MLKTPKALFFVSAIVAVSSCGNDATGPYFFADAGEDIADASARDASDTAQDVADAAVDTGDAVDAKGCMEDRFGESSMTAPIDATLNTSLDELVVCRGTRDWFQVAVTPGQPVVVSVSSTADVVLVVGTEGAVVTDGPGIALRGATTATGDTLVFSVEAGDADAVYSVSVRDDATGAVEASGVVQYEDREFGPSGFTGQATPTAVEGVIVQLVRVDDAEVYDQQLTDAAGGYVLSAEDAPAGDYAVRVLSVGQVDGFQVEVRDRSGASALYSTASEPFAVGEIVERDFVVPVDAPMAGALNIVDQTNIGFRFVARFSDERSPELTYFWQAGLSYSCGSCYQSNRISLGGQTADPDEFDDDIILHEFAHYMVHHFSYDDSSGGAHRDRIVDPLLAYGEGLAYFLSSAIRADATMVDNFLGDARYIDYEAVTIAGESIDDFYGTSDGTAAGGVREELPAALLWDAYDGPSEDEPWDQVSMGDDLLRVLFEEFDGEPSVDVGPRGIEITDTLNALACALGETEGLQALVDERAFPWSIADNLECPVR